MKKLIGLWYLILLMFSCRTQEVEKPKVDVPTKSDKANIISYIIKNANNEEYSFSVDNVKETLTLSLPNDHSVALNNVTPSIVISKGATISPTAEQKCDFSSNKTVSYTVTSESGKTKHYTASVKVLEARKNLEVESIKVYEALVQNDNVTINEKYSIVQESNIEIKFKGEDTPSSFSMSPKVLYLNSKGDSGVIKLSTKQTDIWNAWSETITVKRDGQKAPVSRECFILSFYADGIKGNIDENTKTIRCVLPPNVKNESVIPTITCSSGAVVSPASGEVKDFSKGAIPYTVTAEDGQTTRVYSVTVESGRSNIAEIVSFKIGDVSANIDHKTGKITAEVEKTIPLSAIKPKIEVSKGANVSPASEEVSDFRTPVSYTVTAEDGVTIKTYLVTITHKKSDKAEITSFKIGNANGRINADKTINFVFVFGTNLNNMVPIIEVSADARLSPASGVPQDFSGGKTVKYTVTSEDGNITNEYIVSVKKEPPETRIKIHGENYIPTSGGKGTVKIPKDKNEIKKEDIVIKYDDIDGVEKTIPQEKYSIRGDQTGLTGENGSMILEIILNFGPEYITNATMTIEVSKKA